MASWKPNFNPDYFYFVTTKAVDYLHIFKRDVVKRIILDTTDILQTLANKVTRPEKQYRKIWEDDYNAKDIFTLDTLDFLEQKMDYIHHNPFQQHWKCKTPEEYIWSSARFYPTEEPCIIPIDDVREYLI